MAAGHGGRQPGPGPGPGRRQCDLDSEPQRQPGRDHQATLVTPINSLMSLAGMGTAEGRGQAGPGRPRPGPGVRQPGFNSTVKPGHDSSKHRFIAMSGREHSRYPFFGPVGPQLLDALLRVGPKQLRHMGPSCRPQNECRQLSWARMLHRIEEGPVRNQQQKSWLSSAV
jgi:hypothetical protein